MEKRHTFVQQMPENEFLDIKVYLCIRYPSINRVVKKSYELGILINSHEVYTERMWRRRHNLKWHYYSITVPIMMWDAWNRHNIYTTKTIKIFNRYFMDIPGNSAQQKASDIELSPLVGILLIQESRYLCQAAVPTPGQPPDNRRERMCNY